MKTRVAFYARYSRDEQDRTSITGQFRNCEALAQRHDFEIVARYRDEAISGEADNRPGLLALFAASERGEFDGIVADESSRISRGPGALPRLVAQLAYRRQFLVTKDFDSRGESSQLLASVFSGIDNLEVERTRQRTRRGLRERHTEGFSAGSKLYGYSSVAVDPADEKTRWNKVVDPEQARWVKWIFEEYANGRGVRAIASELNRLGVRSPAAGWARTGKKRADGKWQTTALLGSRKLGTGILRNATYVGRVIWNRTEWLRSPGTGRRTFRVRPRSEWIIREQPELRIVPQELWDRVQARLGEKGTAAKRAGRRGGYLLSGGLLRCAHCGGPLSMLNTKSYGCSTRARGGDHACDNAFMMPRAQAEALYLDAVRAELRKPDVRRAAEREIASALAADDDTSDVEALRAERVEVEAEIERVVSAIVKVGISPALEAKLKEREERQRELRGEIANAERTVAPLGHAEIAGEWDALIETLGEFPKELRTRTETEAARASVLAYVGPMLVDRQGRGTADLQCSEAGGGFVRSHSANLRSAA
jgi:DNA invertase Pin-like site-specific DNA recombinase